MANNIFGKTFAESMAESVNETEKLLHEKKRNFNTQINTEPPLKFWSLCFKDIYFLFHFDSRSENNKTFWKFLREFHTKNKT